MRPVLAYPLAVFILTATVVGAAPARNTPLKSNSAASSSKPEVDKLQANTLKKTQIRKPLVGKPYQIGTASWYGRQFHGKTTASGEPFDMFSLTAAHRKLPLGTWLKVTNLRNGATVVVRVNDRGPVPKSRIIDLSFQAATLLDLRAHGVERVRLVIVKPAAVALNLNLAQLQ